MKYPEIWPTLVFLNGNIYTMDSAHRIVEALALSGSRIVATGPSHRIQRYIGPDTQVIDLQKRTMIPGFIDTHIHFVASALSTYEIDLTHALTLDAIQHLLAQEILHTKPDQWIIASKWNPNLLPSDRLPTKHDLDKLSMTNPIVVKSVDGHTFWVNSQALSVASITSTTPNPSGGVIDREKTTGDPTGILRETAMGLLEACLPPFSDSAIDNALKRAIHQAHVFGITSIHVPEDRMAFQAFQRLFACNALQLRVYMLLPIELFNSILALGLATGFGSNTLRFGAVKVFVDGALGSQTAAMFHPYEGTRDNFGVLVTPKKRLQEILQVAYEHNIQVAAHAIGDKANQLILDVIEHVASYDTKNQTRFRIEHAQHLKSRDISRFSDPSIIACMQPTHISLDMDIADQHLGPRSNTAYRLKSLRNAGGCLAFGSDSPVTTPDPLKGVYAAVTRKKLDMQSSLSWHPEERLTVLEAIQAYTINAARASGEEKIKGSIEPGKLADLVVLSENIFELSDEDLCTVQVDMTIFDGKIVYERQIH
jgi:predicted amidohydrolase YtcJ